MSGKLHFTGIGGAGMAPLAELAMARGCRVSGSDELDSPKCRRLAALGAKIVIGHRPENLPADAGALVYSSAVPEGNCERVRARELGIREVRRGEYLAEFAGHYRRCVPVTGSHGKSSITAALVRILRRCGMDPGFMIGAELKDMPCCGAGDGDIFVTEADESDGTHTLTENFLAVIPNVEDDHEWSLGGRAVLERNFRTVAAKSRMVLYFASAKCDELFSGHPGAVRLPAVPEHFAGSYGFQAANAFIAARAAVLLGCEEDAAVAAAADYPAVARRMTLHRQGENLTVIEDYAHHPTELRASLSLLRRRFPGAHLRVLFQPHRYARLEKYFDEFAEILREPESCFIAPVFAAWSEGGARDAAALARAAGARLVTGSYAEWAALLLADLPEKSVIAVLGAGDVNGVLPYLK